MVGEGVPLIDWSVDPDRQFESVNLSLGDSVIERIRTGPSATRYTLAPGTYELDSLNIPSDTIIEGSDQGQTVLRQRPSASHVHFLRATGSSRVQIQNLTLDVNAQAQPERHTEGERGIQFNGGHTGIVRDVEVVNAGGHSVKWFDWDGGVAHRVFAHSPARTAPNPSGRGAIQAGAYEQVTRNILVHNCYLILPSKCISHRGTQTESVLVTNSRLVDPGEKREWIGVNFHRTTNGLIAANDIVRATSNGMHMRFAEETANISIIGNGFRGPSTQSVEESVLLEPSTANVTFRGNVTGADIPLPFRIRNVAVNKDALTCDSGLDFQLRDVSSEERVANVTC